MNVSFRYISKNYITYKILFLLLQIKKIFKLLKKKHFHDKRY